MVQHWEPYFISSSDLVLEPPKSKYCQDDINNNPQKYYLKHYTSQDNLLSEILQNVTYDYLLSMSKLINMGTRRQPRTLVILLRTYHKNIVYWLLALFRQQDDGPDCKAVKRSLSNHQGILSSIVATFVQMGSRLQTIWTSTIRDVYIRGLCDELDVCQRLQHHCHHHFWNYGHLVLDSAPAVSLRVDAHPCSNNENNLKKSRGDCSYFCTPGPPDVMMQAIEAEIIACEYNKARSWTYNVTSKVRIPSNEASAEITLHYQGLPQICVANLKVQCIPILFCKGASVW